MLLAAKESQRNVYGAVSHGSARSGAAATDEHPRGGSEHRDEPGDADDHTDRQLRLRGDLAHHQDDHPEKEHECARYHPAQPETIEIHGVHEHRVFVAKTALDLVERVLFVVGQRHSWFLLSFPAGRDRAGAVSRGRTGSWPARVAVAAGLVHRDGVFSRRRVHAAGSHRTSARVDADYPIRVRAVSYTHL